MVNRVENGLTARDWKVVNGDIISGSLNMSLMRLRQNKNQVSVNLFPFSPFFIKNETYLK